MSLATLLETAQRTVYDGPVKRAVHRLGLRPYARQAYWAAVSRRVDPLEIRVGDASAAFRVGTLAEYEVVENAAGAERPLAADVLDRVRPGDVFWDVGANVGTYACLVGDLLDDGAVVAVEPYPPNADRLRENLALNGVDAAVREVALSDERGETDLALVKDDGPGTPEHSIRGEYPDPEWVVGSTTVEVRRGDDLAGEVPAPTVLKVDVEGAGPGVLGGLSETLEAGTPRLVYVEPHGNADRLRDLLRDAGFAVESVELAGHRADDEPTIRAVRED